MYNDDDDDNVENNEKQYIYLLFLVCVILGIWQSVILDFAQSICLFLWYYYFFVSFNVLNNYSLRYLVVDEEQFLAGHDSIGMNDRLLTSW